MAGIIGVADHSGWAVLVTVAADATVLDRRRVELVDADLPRMPHHHEAQRLPLHEAVELIERVRNSAERLAKQALDDVARTVPVRGIALRERPQLPATVAERIGNYWAQNRADSVMYREALAAAARARGWFVDWYDAKTVLDWADVDFDAARKSLGPPWQKDHKIAMAAAIVAAAAHRL